ncbi:hypothetical protein HYC85_008904 [Camellia sinensis]|uniref:Uncharacterized protein n=1 Tax=Camellia sinensis TaxID=4442 RepID=A0A7J7HVS0_CAMSI|nr:hypothetical protein HYC85_008904 [Camellia sinensis]
MNTNQLNSRKDKGRTMKRRTNEFPSLCFLSCFSLSTSVMGSKVCLSSSEDPMNVVNFCDTDC